MPEYENHLTKEDFPAEWQTIVAHLPDGARVRVVEEIEPEDGVFDIEEMTRSDLEAYTRFLQGEVSRLTAGHERQATTIAILLRAVRASERVYAIVPLDANEPECDRVAWMPDSLFAEWVDALNACAALAAPPAADGGGE